MVGLPLLPSRPRPRAARSHLSVFHKGCLDPQGTATAGKGKKEACIRDALCSCSAVASSSLQAGLRPRTHGHRPPTPLSASAGGSPQPSWNLRLGCLPGALWERRGSGGRVSPLPLTAGLRAGRAVVTRASRGRRDSGTGIYQQIKYFLFIPMLASSLSHTHIVEAVLS